MTTLLLNILITLFFLANFGQPTKVNSSINNYIASSTDTTNKKTDDLAVTLTVINENQIKVTVQNVSKKIIKAYSHVKCQEKHYDYFEIEALTPDHDKLFFSLEDSRDQSGAIIKELKPGESFSHTIDFIEWAKRSINKGELTNAGLNHYPYGSGIKIRAKYRNQPCENCDAYHKSIWTGAVFSNWINF